MLEASIRRGTLLAVTVLIICVLGVTAALRIPVQMIPDLEVRTISVITGWAGATPQDVEKEILVEQERYLRTLANLKRMVSYAETGRASIELEFPFGVDINEAMIRVSNALSQVGGYPENVDQPRLISNSFSENSFMYFSLQPLEGNPLGLDMNMMRKFVEDNVRTRMERVPGVSQVGVGGASERQVQIHVDPAKLAQRGLTLADVRDRVRARNRDYSGGDLDSGKRRYLLRTVGNFRSVAELEEMILLRSGNAEVRLKDVAEVRMSHFEIRSLAYHDGQRSISLSVNREAGANVIDIKNAMLPVIEEINRDLLAPNGMVITLTADDVRYVVSSIKNVWTNLGLGALLATGVMFLFLRSGRATLVGVMGIPICTVAAFIGLLAFGRTVNVISLAGIAFAIGMTVDNSIVVLENIEQARRRGLDRFNAAIVGLREVWPAVLASTLTTVLVFAPILFIEQEAGQLYSDIAIAISASIIASMLVAISVVPAASARIGFGEVQLHKDPTSGPIMRAIDWLTASTPRRLACMAFILTFSVGAAIVLAPPAEYLPEGEEPKAFSMMIAPPGYNFAEMSKIGHEVRAIIEGQIGADPALFDRGEMAIPPLAYASISISANSLWILTEPVRDRDIQSMMSSLTELLSSYPGMRAFSSRGSIISSNDGGTRAVNLDISGPELAGLYATAENAYRAAQQLFENPQINSDPGSLSLDQPLIEVRPRWERLAEFGMSPDEFGFAVAALSDGAYVDDFFIDDENVDIFMYSDAGYNQSVEELSRLPLRMPNGSVLPLDSLADIHETVNSDSLRRVDGRRTVTLNIIPPRSVALETAVAKVREELVPQLQSSGQVAPGVTLDISGAADQLDATRESLASNFLIALILIYLLLVAIFTHWGYPLFILATVPLGIAGGIVGLAMLNGLGQLAALVGLPGISQPFDMITMLGFLILLGTVVNNPILIVDQTRRNLAGGNMSIEAAVRAAVATRLRPILMSTTTTVFGLAPLVLIPGAGAELYRGVGVIVLAGLICSTTVTLTFLPSLLITVLRWIKKDVVEATNIAARQS